METALANLANFDLPIPDVVVILAAVALLAIANIGSARRQLRIKAQVTDLYQAELTRMSRKVQTTESQLTKAKSELERERQKNRRLKRI
ncbi:hypothetical protein [Actibacterium sp. 188UL27-1]|uniref:hypothetical protein n=1 Tax=Actibacterium sp. 188UL27-1 TaxID=2786961 RepID=UPI001958613F|nr:hypothetical protein [Actibacterium sp. 188UL27-1]MBM7069852.1 hypothetical protein [Actibacterium sp. 188UL27-1]